MLSKKVSAISKRVSSGLTPLRSNPEFWLGGTIPWLKTEQLGEKYIYSTTEKISEAALSKTSIKIYPPNTLSVAMYGEGRTRGNVSIIKTEMTTNQACCNIEIDPEKADFEYVYYFLKTQYNELRNLSSGVRKNLNSEDIKNFVIRLPNSLSDQKKIASVLSSIDAKIDCNNHIHSKLQLLARLLYNYWFVQFDFPNQFGKPYKSSGGKMTYNEKLKREIPEGWHDGSLWDIAHYFNGLAMQKHRPVDDNFLPVIKIKEMGEGISESTEKASPYIPKEAIIDDGDVLFSWSATLDVKIWSQGKGALNQHIFKVTSDKFPKTFFYFELLAYLAHFKMMAERRKTTMGHITQDHLKQSVICIPPIELLHKAHEMLNPVLEKQLLHQKENQRLKQLRDWLLPMLMNGQVTTS